MPPLPQADAGGGGVRYGHAECELHARPVDGGGRHLDRWWRMKSGATVMECAVCLNWWPIDDGRRDTERTCQFRCAICDGPIANGYVKTSSGTLIHLSHECRGVPVPPAQLSLFGATP